MKKASAKERGSKGAIGSDGAGSARRTRRGLVALIAAGIVALVAVVLFVLLVTGLVSPAGAAAKYGLLSYVAEEDVTAYVEGFKNQSNMGDVDDAQWAKFLSDCGMTPETLRLNGVNEVLKDVMAQKKAEELGIQVTEDEIQGELDSLKSTMAFGDDAVWTDTLAMYGQTEEGIHEKYRVDILKRKLCTQEVPAPQPSDEQTKEYIAYIVPSLESNQVKHSYCFKILGLNEEGSLEKMQDVQKVRDAVADQGPSKSVFAAAVAEHSDVPELRETQGGNGWSIDDSEYSDSYVEALSSLGEGGLSPVFNDGDGYAFIWVDEVYDLPTSAQELSQMSLDDMPESLHRYFSDCESRILWRSASDEYLESLVMAEDVLIFPMPADAPYNVDMSLAGE